MKTYRIYAEQVVCYYVDIQASTLKEALSEAESTDYDNWKEIDYYNWEIKEEYTTGELDDDLISQEVA